MRKHTDLISRFETSSASLGEVSAFVEVSITYNGHSFVLDEGVLVITEEHWVFEGELIQFSNPFFNNDCKLSPNHLDYGFPNSELRMRFHTVGGAFGGDRDICRLSESLRKRSVEPGDFILPAAVSTGPHSIRPYHVVALCFTLCVALAWSLGRDSARFVVVIVVATVAAFYAWFLHREYQRRQKSLHNYSDVLQTNPWSLLKLKDVDALDQNG